MKKRLTFILVIILALGSFLTGCDGGGKGQKYDRETRPLVMSTSTPDGVFNPFFSTSAYDSSIVGMTQISMLSADKGGNPICGDDEPTVAKDFRVTTAADKSTTTYEFIIKNGIKFSDGQPLTIKDVLFNLYTYLDPAYTGSATIYSTKIVGLEQYRMQDDRDTIGEGAMSSFEESFYNEAKIRIGDLIDYVQMVGRYPENDRPSRDFTPDQIVAMQQDYQAVSEAFFKELNDDWNMAENSKESYKDWGFVETWQIFLLNDGQMTELLAKDPSGKYIKDDDGNFQLDTVVAADYALELEEFLQTEGYTQANRNEGIKRWAIEEMVFASYFPGTIQNTNGALFEVILNSWVTADTIRDQFAAEIKSDYFKNAARVVPTISGIDGKTTTTVGFDGKSLGASHEVLKITIRGVDPKAIWNFAFTVAPMHYYSTTNYNGKNYIAAFDESKGEFGLEYGSLDFMNKVVNAPNKIGLPMGAGVYKASNLSGSGTVTADNFWNNNMIYFERNTYFETLGSGISNARIKYVKYKVVESDQIINSLANGEIDYGDPSATQDNMQALDEKGVKHIEIETNGYGYVGINPRFVPNITIRRAIIKAMNTSIITNNYYKGGLAELIYRPMSSTSDYYPKGVTVYSNDQLGVDYSYDSTGYDIEQMVIDAGYSKNSNGVYAKNIPGYGVDTLDYKFTIAGGSVDHPAYSMFLHAASILNRIGFAIKVVTSQTALSDLTTGKLTVWAAAWSSAIDPDMYQVYHKDSLATSVNNWGYKQIKANKDTYATEWAIIQQLSDLIDDGRNTVIVNERKAIYAEALDKIMELAVEMPTYQRKDMFAFNSKVLNEGTMTPSKDRTPLNGLLARLWELDYN